MPNRINTREHGFALIEVLISLLVFAIGILAVVSMQYRSIQQNKVASDRTRASNIALSVMEEIKRMPFTSANLADTIPGNGLLAGQAPLGGDPDPALADQRFTLAAFPAMNNGTYAVDAQNRIVDGNGTLFNIFWNVQPTVVVLGTRTYTPSTNLKLFVYWQTDMGSFHIEMDTIIYNNLKV